MGEKRRAEAQWGPRKSAKAPTGEGEKRRHFFFLVTSLSALSVEMAPAEHDQ